MLIWSKEKAKHHPGEKLEQERKRGEKESKVEIWEGS